MTRLAFALLYPHVMLQLCRATNAARCEEYTWNPRIRAVRTGCALQASCSSLLFLVKWMWSTINALSINSRTNSNLGKPRRAMSIWTVRHRALCYFSCSMTTTKTKKKIDAWRWDSIVSSVCTSLEHVDAHCLSIDHLIETRSVPMNKRDTRSLCLVVCSRGEVTLASDRYVDDTQFICLAW